MCRRSELLMRRRLYSSCDRPHNCIKSFFDVTFNPRQIIARPRRLSRPGMRSARKFPIDDATLSLRLSIYAGILYRNNSTLTAHLITIICDLPNDCYQLRVCRSTFGTRAFSVAGPRVWNSLPHMTLVMHLCSWCNRPSVHVNFRTMTIVMGMTKRWSSSSFSA